MDPFTIIFFALLILLYFAVLRPQQKREREHRALMESLQEGDEVITSSGVHGAVLEVDDNIVWLEVAPEVELKLLKSSVASRISEDEEDEDTEELADAHTSDPHADEEDHTSDPHADEEDKTKPS
ncbi:MAG: preprotein translocase subunit YajC [Acidimicrobiaceae bacterium]|nr:preprotein translocase subunit YajC [Acidimicrobiaceae bacterium]